MTTNILFYIFDELIKAFLYSITIVLPLQFIFYITTIFTSMDFVVTMQVCGAIAIFNVCLKLYFIELEIPDEE